jgi:hypothetical protein
MSSVIAHPRWELTNGVTQQSGGNGTTRWHPGPPTADAGSDLVIVVLNELACMGNVRSCVLSGADYAGAIPAA